MVYIFSFLLFLVGAVANKVSLTNFLGIHGKTRTLNKANFLAKKVSKHSIYLVVKYCARVIEVVRFIGGVFGGIGFGHFVK